jgi:DNA-binding transcriptional LysR family regulator
MQDLNDLQFFAAVVSHQSFSAAGRALGLPKSRISRRIALLEERLGIRLLERSTRHLNVTEAGRQVYEHARAAMLEAQAVEEIALQLKAEPRGLVRMSCPIGLQKVISAPLAMFLLANPLLRVQLIVTNRRVDLIEESVDIAVRIRERLDTDGELQMKRLGVSKRILVASPKLFVSTPQPTTPEDLQNYPLLHQQETPGPATWMLVSVANEKANVEVKPRLATSDFGILAEAARAGAGITLLPRIDCRAALTSGELVQILPNWSIADGILHLVFTSRRGMLPGARAVIDFTAETLKVAAE